MPSYSRPLVLLLGACASAAMTAAPPAHAQGSGLAAASASPPTALAAATSSAEAESEAALVSPLSKPATTADLSRAEAAVHANPANARLRVELGLAAGRLGNLERAESDLNQALKMAPDDVDVALGIGVAYYTLGRTDDAIRAWTRGLDIERSTDFSTISALRTEAEGITRKPSQRSKTSSLPTSSPRSPCSNSPSRTCAPRSSRRASKHTEGS